MTGSPPELRSFLEAEMFYGVKKRERIAYAVAGGGLAIGLMGMIAVVTMLPLKQTEAFLAIVDKDTGVAERVVAVEKAGHSTMSVDAASAASHSISTLTRLRINPNSEKCRRRFSTFAAYRPSRGRVQ